MGCLFRCASKCLSFNWNLRCLLSILSNLCTALMVYLLCYINQHHYGDVSKQVFRSALPTPAPHSPNGLHSRTDSPLTSPKPIQIYYYSRDDRTPISDPQHDSNVLCKLEYTNRTKSQFVNCTKPESSLNSTLIKARNVSSTIDTRDTGDSRDGKICDDYVPYVIGITPTYYRLTQRLELTSLCQTLMNVPRFLWIVVEDSTKSSPQVKEILKRCPVESILLHIKTTNESKVAKQKGIDQRNHAIDWIRSKCGDCKGRGTCEGVVYFMDDDNTYDIRLFERIRWTRDVSVFPVGLVAGSRFEGPICKDGKVESWQVQYSPKRHIPVDMAGFAINVQVFIKKAWVRMGFKSDNKKRSTPGYLEPDFLRNIGAKRETVECRGLPDQILVWHVKATYKKLIYEGKHPSDPKIKV